MSKAFDESKNTGKRVLSFKKKDIWDESFEELCERHWFLPPDKLRGLDVYHVPHTIKKNAYLSLHIYLTAFYHQTTLSYKNLNDRLAMMEFLDRSPPSPNLNILCYKAYLLFGSVEKLQRFSNRCETLGYKKYDSLACMESIVFPGAHLWNYIDFRQWGEAYIQHGYEKVNPHFLNMARDIAPMRNKSGILSMEMTKFNWMARQHSQPIPKQHLDQLIQLSVRFNKSDNEFNRIMHHTSQMRDPHGLPPQKLLPGVFITGDKFGLPGATFRKMYHQDPRLLFLGDYTNCCERVTDTPHSLEQTVAQALRAQNNAYYIVERGSKILCHSWAWRGRHGEFVFDGFESKSENFKLKNLYPLLQNFVQAVAHEKFRRYDVNGIMLGRCADHLTFEKRYPYIKDSADIMPKSIKGVGMTQDDLKIIQHPVYSGEMYQPASPAYESPSR